VKALRPPVQRSLKARALQLLAQREHSRAELRRKLLVHARADMLPGLVADASATDVGAPLLALAPVDPLTRVDTVLDWLEAHNYLSQERFVESRVHARAARFGNLRIRQELAQHALTLSPQAAQALKDSEFDRAHAVWARKYAAAPEGLAEHARQARFLASRGFSADVIRQLLRGAGRARASPAEVEFPED
jgi:regulatory protein